MVSTPPPGGGDRHLATVPPGVEGKSRPWGDGHGEGGGKVLKKVWEPLHIQDRQCECGYIPIRHSLKSPQGIAQWCALAAHWSLRNTYRKGGIASLDALLTIWVKFTALIVGWEPLSAFSHVFRLFHDRLVRFKSKGVIIGPGIVYVESSDQET